MNPKFGRHPISDGYSGRRIDVLVRSIKNCSMDDPLKTLHKFLQYENTASSRELAKKAIVLLSPKTLLGTVAWYK